MEAKRECDQHVTLLHYLAALQGSKKSHMHMKVPSTTTHSFLTLSPLLTAGKNKVGHILDRVV
jgi:hypothetical protein